MDGLVCTAAASRGGVTAKGNGASRWRVAGPRAVGVGVCVLKVLVFSR
jgi:hypothetical protein